ncbi:patatin-like phospholipase [Yoonia maricola]|uniref:Patatin-like phospholipase n=1 Tax=Yoonia maricola TaxID=420999 RepID=A0A2M8W4Y3_9RHOB|nr:patatin-like phospholipase family protein [Yoonia maricola]PJI85981.1 patatin-like phospholipase [Yoonia maricola]
MTLTPLRINRRVFFWGGSLALIGACSPTAPDLQLPSREQADPLRKYRVAEFAPYSSWARHIHESTMRDAPDILAISGGGEDGAFGAGLLNGWSARGDRPRFDVVTGISAGALIAPFAFLGPAYDAQLKQVFTEFGGDDVLRRRGLPGLLGSSVYDTKPMADLLRTFVAADIIDAIAERHHNGARLFVVTSNLDTARADIWNMGALAVDGQDDLLRSIVLASSALPAVFPPVPISYRDKSGQIYRETHLDGGLNMQFLAIPEATPALARNRQGRLFILINNTIDPAPQSVPRSIIGISTHSLSTLVRSSARSGLRAAELAASDSQLQVFAVSVEPDSPVVYDPSERFSLDYMIPLFDYGYQRGLAGDIWSD